MESSSNTSSNHEIGGSTAGASSKGYAITREPVGATAQSIALVHIGPHKTATCTMQAILYKSLTALEADGFRALCEDVGAKTCSQHSAAFRLHGAQRAGDWSNPQGISDEEAWRFFEADVRNATVEGKNIVFSSEELDRPQVDIKLLVSVLADYELRVLIAHRRFDSWIRSVHSQVTYHSNAGRVNVSHMAQHYQPLIDWITEETFSLYVPMHTAALKARWEAMSKIQIVDFADDVDIVQDMFCSQFTSTPHTCEYVSTHSFRSRNPSVDDKAVEVVYAAYLAGWLQGTAIVDDVIESLLDSDVFARRELPLRCPSPSVYDRLRGEVSAGERAVIEARPDVVPDRENRALAMFEEAMRWDLCSIDAAAFAGSQAWKLWFEDYAARPPVPRPRSESAMQERFVPTTPQEDLFPVGFVHSTR